jgi:hypothetical protein
MIKRLFAIGFIFACTSIAWGILAGVTAGRTHLADSGLRSRVQHLWGMPQVQQPPVAIGILRAMKKQERLEDGKKIVEMVEDVSKERVGMEASDVRAALALEHRQKGLLWYSTYKVTLDATYVIVNDSPAKREFEIALPFPAKRAVFDDLQFEIEGKPWVSAPAPGDDKITGRVYLDPGERVVLKAGYRSQGLDRWTYGFGEGVSEVRNFRLAVRTDFADIDFPEDGMSPARKERSGGGWLLTWEFRRLVSGITIGVVMPEKLQPGPLASQIAGFAPVSLFFFIVVLLTIGVVKGIELHPMHFFFLSAAFFAFHLLFAYLADQVSIHSAFAIAAVVSLALVTSYLRLVFGSRFAFFAAGAAQLLYLVLFSYAFFFKGLTGLAITIGAVVTLFVLMQATAKVEWGAVFAGRNARVTA